MLNITNEKGIEKYPFQISIKETSKIIEQHQKCVCQIIQNGARGTGFFCKFINYYDGKEMRILITNNHILGNNELNQKNIKIALYNGFIITLKLNNSRKIFTKKEPNIGITIIELKEEDKIINYLELDEDFFQNKAESLNSKHRSKAYIPCFIQMIHLIYLMDLLKI